MVEVTIVNLKEELNKTASKVNEHINLLLKNEPELLSDASLHLIKTGGKRLRPFLVIKSCEMFDENSTKAVPVAAALELVHNFTLVHDDIMDKSDIILEQIKQLNKTIHTRDKELYDYIRERVEEIHKYIERLEKSFDDKFNLFETKMTKVYMTLDSTQERINEHDWLIKRIQNDFIEHTREHNKENRKGEKKVGRIWNYIIPTATGITVALVMFFLNGGFK